MVKMVEVGKSTPPHSRLGSSYRPSQSGQTNFRRPLTRLRERFIFRKGQFDLIVALLDLYFGVQQDFYTLWQ
jgi:hypothetical protein